MKPASSDLALCGLLCAAAVTVMCLGGLVPAATFCCPVLASMALLLAQPRVGARLLWCMYAAIAILSLLLCPDREAAAVFLALGYYPIVRPAFDRLRPVARWCAKLALFYAAVALAYAALLFVLRADGLQESGEMTQALALALLVLGGAVFILYDQALRVLTRRLQKSKRRTLQ